MIKFGPAGNCESFYNSGHKHSYEAPQWLNKIGLNAFEYSFGKGILLSDEMAVKIGEEMKKYGITPSIHAPYFINFANPSDEMVEKSYGYVLNSLQKLKLMGGTHLVVHTASCGKMDREDAVELTKKRLRVLKDKIIEAGYTDMYICLETMGKSQQIGTVDEIIDFCTIYDHYMPTFDFGHINALTQGTLKSESDYEEIILKCLNNLGEYRTKNVHIHFSKIEYSAKGEVRHLTMEDEVYGPEFEPLARVIKKYSLTPTIICESKGIMAIDACKLRDIYNNVEI